MNAQALDDGLVRDIQAAIEELPAGERALIQSLATTIRKMVRLSGPHAGLAIALIGAELSVPSCEE